MKAKSRVRTPRCAIGRSLAVPGTSTPRASATSRPCAHVSIRRAVAIEAGLIGGPNHCSLRPSGTSRSALCRASRVTRHSASICFGGVPETSDSAAASTKPDGSVAASATICVKPGPSVTDVSATRSVHHRWAI